MKLTKHCLFGGLALSSIITIILAIIAVFVTATVRPTAWLVVILTVIAWLVFAFFVNAEDEEATPEENESAKRFEKIYMIGSAVATVIAIIILLLSFFGIGVAKKSEPAQVPVTTTTIAPIEETTETTIVVDEELPIDVEVDDEDQTTRRPTQTPATQRPTQAPATQRPTQAPATQRPAQAPATQRPATTQRPTQVPTTQRPTQAPTTQRPTQAPTTERPTQAPTTERPTQPPTTSHEHQVARYANPSTTYEHNGSKHVKVVYQGDKICSCGHNMGKGTTTRTEENHSYGSNDKCVCGAIKPAEKSIILSCTRQDAYGDPAMGPNDTVTLTLKNMTVSEVEYYWVNSETGARQTTGVTLVHLYGDVYEIILSDEVWEYAADIQIKRPGSNNYYTVTLEPQY